MERNITSTDYNILLPVMPILSEYRPEDINSEFSFGDIDLEGNIKWAFVVSNDTSVPDGWEEDDCDPIYHHVIDIYIRDEKYLEDLKLYIYITEKTNDIFFIRKAPWTFISNSNYVDLLDISIDEDRNGNKYYY